MLEERKLKEFQVRVVQEKVNRHSRQRLNIPEYILRELYIDNELSSNKIAKLLGVCRCIIRRHIKALGLTRSFSEQKRIDIKQGMRRPSFEQMSRPGPSNPNWKGGKMHNCAGGYVQIWAPWHPRAHARCYVYEHILVWERVHGGPVPDGYHIHHINGVKDDNCAENLVALPEKQHDKLALLHKVQTRIRQLEAENRKCRKALKEKQLLFLVGA